MVQFECLALVLICLINCCECQSCQKPVNSDTSPESCEQQEALNSCESATGARCDTEPPMALVLYDESRVSPFHRDTRTFQFGEREVVIRQRWNQGGVAAVVWDAVRKNS